MVLESEEESGSPHLIELLAAAKHLTGKPDFMVCMDSQTFDFESMWLTSSKRGICNLDVTVKAAIGGYHSGGAGGRCPETFRVFRALLDRIDDAKTGVCSQDF